MELTDFERMNKAHECRKMAKRYRYLATCIGDEKAIEALEAMSRESDETAERIEREVLLHANIRDRDHAA